MPGSLQNKVVLITGASSGIGRATSFALANAGANVVLFARSKEKLSTISGKLGKRALICPGDVTRQEDLKLAVQATIDRFGHIDVLFANAGVYISGKISGGDPDAWSQLVDVNVKGVFFSVDAVFPFSSSRNPVISSSAARSPATRRSTGSRSTALRNTLFNLLYTVSGANC